MPPYHKLFQIPNRVRRMLLALALLFIVAASMRHGRPPEAGRVPLSLNFSLNIGHQLLYGFFTLAALLRLDPGAPLRRSTWVALLTLVFFMGVADEWNQGFRGDRDTGMNDVISDTLGCLHILILTRWFSFLRPKPTSVKLILLLTVIALIWNTVVVFAPDPPLPFLSS
jgi:VanZ family protein